MREDQPLTEQDHQPHLLVAEDDTSLAEFLRRELQADQWAVDVVHDGESAFQAVRSATYDLLILDLGLPKLDGMSLLRQLRPTRPGLPILVITGRTDFEDRVMALDCGANDCLVKPFSVAELTARAQMLLRRSEASFSLRVQDLILDREHHRVERAGKRIVLTPKEFRVLEFLMRNPGRVVTRPEIMEFVWKTAYDGHSNLVDVYVKYVRDKIDKDFPRPLLHTIRGVGYSLRDE